MEFDGKHQIIYLVKLKKKEKEFVKYMVLIWDILNLEKFDIGMLIM
jgi:hypothetical protein